MSSNLVGRYCMGYRVTDGFFRIWCNLFKINAIETPILVQSQANSTANQTHSRSPECHSRQAVQTQTGDPDRVVSPSGGFRPSVSDGTRHLKQTCLRFNHKLLMFVSPVPDQLAWQVDASSLPWQAGLGSIAFRCNALSLHYI